MLTKMIAVAMFFSLTSATARAEFEGVSSLTRTDEGAFEVTCTDGTSEIATINQLRRGYVCEGQSSRIWVDPVSGMRFRLMEREMTPGSVQAYCQTLGDRWNGVTVGELTHLDVKYRLMSEENPWFNQLPVVQTWEFVGRVFWTRSYFQVSGDLIAYDLAGNFTGGYDLDYGTGPGTTYAAARDFGARRFAVVCVQHPEAF